MQDFEQLDYYELLGIDRTASAEEIKRAYRQQITRYHPDRYVNDPPEAQEYAGQRAQRINEAYSVLSDFNARSAYNRGQLNFSARAPIMAQAPTAPRDHQAELYAQAQTHLAAGRNLQAAAVLRQLQQINPFYRDSAALLAQAEAQARPASAPVQAAPAERNSGQARPEPMPRPAAPPTRPAATRRWLIGSALGGAALVVLVALVINLRGQVNSAATNSTGDLPPGSVAVPTPSVSGAPSATPAPSTTSAPTATSAPSTTPAPSATSAPSSTPAPTTAPEPTVVAEQGTLLFADDFSGAVNWATVQQRSWSVGYAGDSYRITVDPGAGNIWSFGTVPGTIDYSLGADVQVRTGSAGLLLRYADRSNYLACFISPERGTYRIEQRSAGRVRVVAEGASDALKPADTNRLVARINGSALSLLINGIPVEETTIQGLIQTRLYGMIAVAGDAPAEALFDNLEVRELGDGG